MEHYMPKFAFSEWGMFPCACGWVDGRGRKEGVGIVPFHLSAYLGFTVPIPGLKQVSTEGKFVSSEVGF